MYIRRNRSNLRFGRYGPQRTNRILLIVWLVVMLAAVAVIWRFDQVQHWMFNRFVGEPTATPDPVLLAMRGENAYLHGDLEQAITYYRQAHQLAPDDIGILFELGRMMIYRSYAGRDYSFRAAEALEIARKGAELTPDDPRALALLSLALLENGFVEEAIVMGLKAVDQNPSYSEAWAYLSMAYRAAQRNGLASEAAAKAIECDPYSLDARRAMALSLTALGQPDAALGQYNEALRIHPYLDMLYFEMAWLYLGQENYDAALTAYNRVLALEPDNVKAYTRKCETYYRMGEFHQAQEVCEQAVQLDPTYTEAFQQLGKVQYKSRNFEGAVETLTTCADLQKTQGLSLAQSEVDCWYIRGLALAYLDECDKAWLVLQDALLMNATDDIQRAIHQGLMLCVDHEPEYDLNDLPTPMPITPTPFEPVQIY